MRTSQNQLVLSCLTKYPSFEPFMCLDLTFGSCKRKTYLYCFHLIVIVNAMLVFNRVRSYKGSWMTTGGVVINTISANRQRIRKRFWSSSAATARLKQVHVVRPGYHCGDSKSVPVQVVRSCYHCGDSKSETGTRSQVRLSQWRQQV